MFQTMNNQHRSICALILAIGCATLSPSSFATHYYKWVDAKGTTHYTKTPPPASAKQKGKVHTYGSNTTTTPTHNTPVAETKNTTSSAPSNNSDQAILATSTAQPNIPVEAQKTGEMR